MSDYKGRGFYTTGNHEERQIKCLQAIVDMLMRIAIALETKTK